MPSPEFSLIDHYFSNLTSSRPDVELGIGDDCALLRVPPGKQLAVSLDTLVAGRHFLPDCDPEALGHKALAVNLSDLAAMGAEPAWATLGLTLPEIDETWLTGFARGFGELAECFGVQLVGGDTTRGPLAISIQIHGLVSPERVMRRDGARPGDLIYVTGTLGDAGLALLAAQGLYVAAEHLPALRRRLDRPEPRVAAGQALAGLATAAIDISDGLSSDLGHILKRSSLQTSLGAALHLDKLPLSPGVAEYLSETADWSIPMAAGDDYELCITVPERRQAEVERLAGELDCGLTWIGMIEAQAGLRALLPNGEILDQLPAGFDHFAR